MSEEVGTKRWYAVHTYSGYENKVKKNLEKSRINEYDRANFRVVIPEEKKHKLKMGKQKQVKKTFPGYVLVELIMTDESWYVVRNTQVSQDLLVQQVQVQNLIHYFLKK